MLAMIDGRDGHVMWTLGGKNSDFTDLSGGNATNFGWQHDAQLSGANDIILFDNHVRSTERCDGGDCASRALRLRLDQEQKTVELVQELRHPEGVNSGRMGGVQLLKEGHSMVAWGDNPSFVEYNKAGQPVLDVQRGLLGVGLQEGMYAYRVSRHRWQGEPSWPPSVAVDAPSKSTANATVYVSWNGATDVAQWAIVSLSSETRLPISLQLLIRDQSLPRTLPTRSATTKTSSRRRTAPGSRRKSRSTAAHRAATLAPRPSRRAATSWAPRLCTTCAPARPSCSRAASRPSTRPSRRRRRPAPWAAPSLASRCCFTSATTFGGARVFLRLWRNILPMKRWAAELFEKSLHLVGMG